MNKHRMPMSAPMIRAIQREIEQPGTGKTMTRRLVKPQPLWVYANRVPVKTHDADLNGVIKSPYGRPGDLLAFTETFGSYGSYSPPGKSWEFSEIVYRADAGDKAPDRWRPPMFMPYWVSRYTGLITDVRVERLQDITSANVKSEGVRLTGKYQFLDDADNDVAEFADLWESIHGPVSWEANPWVWVYTFRPIAANVLDVEREPERYGVAC